MAQMDSVEFRWIPHIRLSKLNIPPPKARPRHLYMSWPSDKPPWKHVKWCTYDAENTSSINNWKYPPNPEWSILLPMPIISGDLY